MYQSDLEAMEKQALYVPFAFESRFRQACILGGLMSERRPVIFVFLYIHVHSITVHTCVGKNNGYSTN